MNGRLKSNVQKYLLYYLETYHHTGRELARTRSARIILSHTQATISHFGVGTGIVRQAEQIAGIQVDAQRVQAKLPQQLRIKRITQRKVVQTHEGSILHETVATQPVIAFLEQGTGNLGHLALHTPTPVDGSRLVVVVVHGLGIHAGGIHHLVAHAEVELRIERPTTVCEFQAPSTGNLR